MNSAVYQSTLQSDMRPSVMAKAWIELGQDDDQNRLTGKKQKSRFCNCLNCCSGKGGYESCAEKNAHKEAKVIYKMITSRYRCSMWFYKLLNPGVCI